MNAKEYEDMRDVVIADAWEAYTKNSLIMDYDDGAQVQKTIADAANNAWQPGMDAAEWLAATLASLPEGTAQMNSINKISVNVIYGRVDQVDRDNAARAACEFLDRARVKAADACAEYNRQWDELDTEDGMTGLAVVWIDATAAADLALTAGWNDINGAACSISA